MESYEQALQGWLGLVNAMIEKHWRDVKFVTRPAIVELDKTQHGKNHGKYHRIVRAADGSTFCFIQMSNGDVLKPASWRGPAPTARGNIYTREQELGVNVWGAKYIQRGKAK